MKKMIIGIIISCTVGVVAFTTISSKNVTYQNKTVNNAFDELYNEATTGKELVAAAITNKGIPTTSTDTYETMAANINSIDNSHNEIYQKISNLESKHNSDISTITGSISNLNQSLIFEKDVNIGDVNSWAGNYFHNFSYSDYGIDTSIVDVISATFINYTYVGTLGILIGENKEQFYITCSNPQKNASKVLVKFCLRNKLLTN